jgi:hypothetical protein
VLERLTIVQTQKTLRRPREVHFFFLISTP